jgi:hypothetical protein
MIHSDATEPNILMCGLGYKYPSIQYELPFLPSLSPPLSSPSLSLPLSLTSQYQFIVYFLYVYYKCRHLNKVTYIRAKVLV